MRRDDIGFLNPSIGAALNGSSNLNRTLLILDRVGPHVSSWYRDLEKRRMIKITEFDDDRFCHFDFLTRKLYLNRPFFKQTDGVKASMLCHEFRHSLQNYGKWLRCVLSYGRNDRILESEAEAYERQAYDCIFRFSNRRN